MTKTLRLRREVMRSVLPGILTRLIVSLAISVGETAPLIYTAGYSNSYPPLAFVHKQIGYLPGAIYSDYSSSAPALQTLAHDDAVLLIALVLILILTTRVIVLLTQKYSPNRAASSTSRRDRRAARAVVDGGFREPNRSPTDLPASPITAAGGTALQ